MEAQYKTRDGRIVFKVTGEAPKDLFKGIAQLQEIFEADSQCGCCDSNALRYSVRTVEDNDYYELVCSACHAKLSFGQHKKGGTLFAKREGESRGWKKWEPQRSDAPVSGPRAVGR